MKRFAPALALALIAIPMLAPAAAFAWVPGQSLIPCSGVPADSSTPQSSSPGATPEKECTFGDLITLASNVMDALFFFSIPAVAIVFSYAGFEYMTAMGNKGQVDKAKKIFTNVLIGFLFMVSGWLIVKFIMIALLAPSFISSIPIQF